jgi:PAS domain S-box-containing protein
MLISNDEVCRGIEHDEFVPFFQPVVTLRTGQLAGFEVLARWHHPAAGILSPDRFIPIAEKNGWIDALTKRLMEKAFEAGKLIPEPLTLAFNISPLQLHDPGLPKRIHSAAEDLGFPLHRVVIEVTESAVVDNVECAQTVAKELKALGCKIALDDFGTGYSSLLHLQSLPFDELKVDRSFVDSMIQRRESRKIVAAVVGLGQSLGLATVAEGIETREQAEMLLWLGCEMGQGWLFGRPAPAEDLPATIAMSREKISLNHSTSLWGDLTGNALPSQRLAHLQAVYDGAPVGLALLDRNLRYVTLNQRLAEMNSAPVDEHLRKTVEEMVPKAFHHFEPFIRRSLEGEVITGVEARRPAGLEQGDRDYLLSYQPVRDEADEVIGVSVAVVDITDRKAAEAALRESEDHFRHMVELNPQIPWVLDADGNATAISPRWEQVTGMSAATAEGRGFLEAIHPEDRTCVEDVIAESTRSGDPIDVECRVLCRNKRWRWIRSRGAARRDPSGKIIRWYGSADDIDDQKKAEEALRRSEEQLKAIFNSVPVAILLAAEPDGRLSLSNPEARRIFRYPAPSRQSIENYAQWGAIRVDGRRLESAEFPLARALRGEKTKIEEALCLRADGTEAWVSLRGAPIVREDGSVQGAVVVVQDIDEIKRERERLLTLAEALIRELKGQTPSARLEAGSLRVL